MGKTIRKKGPSGLPMVQELAMIRMAIKSKWEVPDDVRVQTVELLTQNINDEELDMKYRISSADLLAKISVPLSLPTKTLSRISRKSPWRVKLSEPQPTTRWERSSRHISGQSLPSAGTTYHGSTRLFWADRASGQNRQRSASRFLSTRPHWSCPATPVASHSCCQHWLCTT